MRYFGFDLGDGESCLSLIQDTSIDEPVIIPVNGENSFVTAVADYDGETVIGSLAAGSSRAERLRVCFKRNFRDREDGDAREAMRRFISGVYATLSRSEQWAPFLKDADETSFVIGCPAGWSRQARDEYRTLFRDAGFPNVHMVSESRAALLYTLKSRIDGIDPSALRNSVLVIDIGSSTLDFAYVRDGRETNVGVLGDTALGGGLLDEMILTRALQDARNAAVREEAEAILANEPHWKSWMMLEARALKERFFSDEAKYLAGGSLMKKLSVYTSAGKKLDIILELSESAVAELIDLPHPLLAWQSFRTKVQNSLNLVRQHTGNADPELVLLTGGASRMGFFRELCASAFPGSHIAYSPSPEYDIARGLAYAGRMDNNLELLLNDVRAYVDSDAVEIKVRNNLVSLIDSVSGAIGESVLESSVLPAFRAWQSGALKTLNDFQTAAADSVRDHIRTDETQEAIRSCAVPWTAGILAGVQADIDHMCRQYGIDVGRMQLDTLRIAAEEAGIDKLELPFVTVIDSIVSVVAVVVLATLSGGTGIALLAEGPVGLILGAVIGLLAALLGRTFVDKLLTSLETPVFLRKLVRESSVLSESNRARVIASIRESLRADAGLQADLTAQISTGIDNAIRKVAEEQAILIDR